MGGALLLKRHARPSLETVVDLPLRPPSLMEFVRPQVACRREELNALYLHFYRGHVGCWLEHHSLTTITVVANSTSFSPDAIDVAPGDTIVWQYNSGYPHTVTSGVPCTADGLFYGELQGGGDTFTWEVPLDASEMTSPTSAQPPSMRSMGMTGCSILTRVEA